METEVYTVSLSTTLFEEKGDLNQGSSAHQAKPVHCQCLWSQALIYVSHFPTKVLLTASTVDQLARYRLAVVDTSSRYRHQTYTADKPVVASGHFEDAEYSLGGSIVCVDGCI